MTITLHATPYNTAYCGFYFSSLEEYQNNYDIEHKKALKNGDSLEEYEIQCIDSNCSLEQELFNAMQVNQATLKLYFEALELEHYEMMQLVAMLHFGYTIEYENGEFILPDYSDVTIYENMTYSDLAEEFVEEGLFGEITEHLKNYIDYDAIADDLAYDYTEMELDNKNCIVRIN